MVLKDATFLNVITVEDIILSIIIFIRLETVSSAETVLVLVKKNFIVIVISLVAYFTTLKMKTKQIYT